MAILTDRMGTLLKRVDELERDLHQDVSRCLQEDMGADQIGTLRKSTHDFEQEGLLTSLKSVLHKGADLLQYGWRHLQEDIDIDVMQATKLCKKRAKCEGEEDSSKENEQRLKCQKVGKRRQVEDGNLDNPVVPAACLLARNPSDISLGSWLLDVTRTRTWSHPSPAAGKVVWDAFKAFHLCDGDMRRFEQCWLALLASPGLVLFDNRSSSLMGLVLASNQYLVIYLPLDLRRAPTGELFMMCKIDSKPKAAVVTALKGIRAIRVKAVSPTKLSQLARGSNIGSAIGFVKDGPGGSLLEAFAAREGFKQLTKPFLDKLLDLQQIVFKKGERPSTVKDIVKYLVRHFIPSASAEEIATALAKRKLSGCKHDLSLRSVLAKGDNIAAVATCLNEADTEIVGEAVAHAQQLTREVVDPSAE